MLALAQKTAAEHTSRAKAEADAVLADARAKAAALEQSAATERQNLERRVEELRAFEREYRTRLRQHHEAALKDLDHRGTEGAPGGPRRTRGPGRGRHPHRASAPRPPSRRPLLRPPPPGCARRAAGAPGHPAARAAGPAGVAVRRPGESTPPPQA